MTPSQTDPPLTDAEIAAFVRRLVREAVQEETKATRRPRSSAPVPVLLPKEVAQRWGCSERTVRNMIADGRLPGYRIGTKLLRVRLDDVERYEREKEQTEPEEQVPPSAPPSPNRDPLTRLRLAELRRRGRNSAQNKDI